MSLEEAGGHDTYTVVLDSELMHRGSLLVSDHFDTQAVQAIWATNDGSIALFRQSLASSRACLCETGFPRRIRASSR